MKITRALISVSNKSGLQPFVTGLHEMEVEILSTGKTANAIRDWNIPVVEVAEYTKCPECFGGRVKTLHPKVHGGVLYRREDPQHLTEAKELGIPPIDLVVVNLYPFGETIAKPNVNLEEAIENIDVGGPAMLRSAAKNYEHVTVICNPSDYTVVLTVMKTLGGSTTSILRQHLALEAFCHTRDYDASIAEFMKKRNFELFDH